MDLLRSFALDGLSLGVHGAPGMERVLDAVSARLAQLPVGRSEDGSGDDDLRFEFVAARSEADFPERPAGARPVYDPPGGEVLYQPAGDLLYIRLGERLAALCEPARRRTRILVQGLREEDLWLLSHPLFTLPLAELAKRRGLYNVHAASLALNGRALVLPGTSGAGKSTLAVALAQAGLSFMGDDMLFLSPRPGAGEELRLLAFPDEIDLTDESAAFFPDLAPHLTAPSHGGWRKLQLAARLLEPPETAGPTWECTPGILVFPHVSGEPDSRLTEIAPDEALLELAPNVFLTEPRSSQAHLDALSALAAASDCYRLETGRDLAAAARLLRGLLERRAG
jgi:hypothetical protein